MKKYIFSVLILTSVLVVNSCKTEREPYVPDTSDLTKKTKKMDYNIC